MTNGVGTVSEPVGSIWTDEEVAALAGAIRAFRDGLSRLERNALDLILGVAGEVAGHGDVRGYFLGGMGSSMWLAGIAANQQKSELLRQVIMQVTSEDA